MSRKKKTPKRKERELSRRLRRVGVVTRQPLMWASVSALMAVSGVPKLRRAAGRATACYLVGAVIGNFVKPLFGRAQPRHRRLRKPQVMRGSFPSGHGAAEVAYVFGASQEAPAVFLPLGTAAALAHWSLLRAGKHYPSDMLVGGTIGLIVAAVSAGVKPPGGAGGGPVRPGPAVRFKPRG